MTAQFKPRNLLEHYMNQHSFERVAAAEKAANSPKTLKEIKTRDASGRTITDFEGSPSAWMQDFGMAPKKVVAINTK